jgi:hypothetical protein
MVRKPKPKPGIPAERLAELRDCLAKLDPAGRKAWILEVYELRAGQDKLAEVVNIKTGRPYRRPKNEQAAEAATNGK